MSKASVVIETYGFEGLEKTFKNFQYKDKRAIFLNAFRKATRPTVEMAKRNAPIGKTGNLNKSIGVVPIADDIGIWVGARVIGGYRGFHGHLLEEGTGLRSYTTKKGNTHRTGRMSQNASYSKFFQKAVEATEDQVMDTVKTEWYNAIARMIVRTK
jgi:hypothetical protein